MKKSIYVVPETEVVYLDVDNEMMENIIGAGSTDEPPAEGDSNSSFFDDNNDSFFDD